MSALCLTAAPESPCRVAVQDGMHDKETPSHSCIRGEHRQFPMVVVSGLVSCPSSIAANDTHAFV